MRVDGVVHQSPAKTAGVERERDVPVNRACNGGPPEERAPVECQAYIERFSTMQEI